jgi:hypothetical protein
MTWATAGITRSPWRKSCRPARSPAPGAVLGRGTPPAEDGADWDEDDDGNRVPAAEPEPGHVYDLARINRALAPVTDEPDETGDLAQ